MIDFKDLLKAGVHFGHKTSFGNPKMKPYIWGAKNRIHLIDISKTAVLLERAGKVLKELASNGSSILWVGTKKPAQPLIEKAGKTLKMPFVVNRWIGGTLSNYAQVKKAITRYLHLQDILKKGSSFYTKKELVMLQKQINRLEKNIGGIVDLTFPPAAIVVVDAKKEHSAVKEAHGMNIPVISLVDSNTDPSFISYVIPGNDDSPKSITFVIDYLISCAEEGKKIAETTKKTEPAPKKASSKTTKPEEEETEPGSKKTPAKTKPTKEEIIPEEAIEAITEEDDEEKTPTTKKTFSAKKPVIKKPYSKK